MNPVERLWLAAEGLLTWATGDGSARVVQKLNGSATAVRSAVAELRTSAAGDEWRNETRELLRLTAGLQRHAEWASKGGRIRPRDSSALKRSRLQLRDIIARLCDELNLWEAFPRVTSDDVAAPVPAPPTKGTPAPAAAPAKPRPGRPVKWRPEPQRAFQTACEAEMRAARAAGRKPNIAALRESHGLTEGEGRRAADTIYQILNKKIKSELATAKKAAVKKKPARKPIPKK